MAKDSVNDWDETAANNTDIANIPVAGNVTFINQLDNIVQTLMAQIKSFFKSSVFNLRDGADQTKKLAFDLSGITTGTTRTLVVPDKNGTLALTSEVLVGALSGLGTSNNTGDANNDIDIAAGIASSDAASPVAMQLASALTKRLDAAWAAGSGNGGLDTGAKANNTWYYLWLIQRTDGTVTDALFSLSATAPTMPANYSRKRRIGAVRTDGSGNIRAFSQYGDRFIFAVPVTDVNTTIGTSASLLTLTLPPIQVTSIFNARVAINAAFAVGYLSGPDQTDLAPNSTSVFSLITDSDPNGANATGQFQIDSRTSQVRARSSIASTTVIITTLGWIDPRR